MYGSTISLDFQWRQDLGFSGWEKLQKRAVLTAYAAARRFMSQPMVQTEALCSIAKVTAMDCRVPMKQTKAVRES